MKIVKETLYEKFTEKSDPIKDMGIGVKPDDVLYEFVKDFLREFDIELYVDTTGNFFDEDPNDAYTMSTERQDQKHPAITIISSEGNELILAMNDNIAKKISRNKNAKWGWIYYDNGKPFYLKDAYMFEDVMKQIMKIRNNTSSKIDKAIKKYKTYTETLEKFKKFV